LGLGIATFAITLPVGEAVSQEDPYLKCADIKKSKRRLKCYDTVIKEQHPEMFEKMEEARIEEQREEFGLPRGQAGDKDTEVLERVEVMIIENAKSRNGKWLLVTEDGQVWLQSGIQTFFLRKKPFAASLKKGLFGSFFLVITGTKKTYRVKRVK
jgi:hypothetical protein